MACAFYVRAVDDDDATSLPDKVAFTARTIAPRSKISRPRVSESFLILGDSLHVSWRAYDLDGPRHRPKGIYYALVHPIPNFICLGSCPPGLLIGAAPWTFVGADTTSLILPLEVPTSYVLAIRAVDENGVVEPFVDGGETQRCLQLAQTTRPSLTISFAGQSFTFPNSSDQTSIQIPARREAVFYLGCSAEAYGESIDGAGIIRTLENGGQKRRFESLLYSRAHTFYSWKHGILWETRHGPPLCCMPSNSRSIGKC